MVTRNSYSSILWRFLCSRLQLNLFMPYVVSFDRKEINEVDVSATYRYAANGHSASLAVELSNFEQGEEHEQGD